MTNVIYGTNSIMSRPFSTDPEEAGLFGTKLKRLHGVVQWNASRELALRGVFNWIFPKNARSFTFCCRVLPCIIKSCDYILFRERERSRGRKRHITTRYHKIRKNVDFIN